MTPVTTQVYNIYVKISWSAPINNGAEITAYNIEILNGDGFTYSSSANCNGADSTIVSQLYCMVPMEELTSATGFNLAYSTLIQAKAQAYNLKGWGGFSNVNTAGARAEVVPQTMALPTRGVLTDESQAEIDWVQFFTTDEVGGLTASILSYNLQWDSGTDGSTWTDLIGIESVYIDNSYLHQDELNIY